MEPVWLQFDDDNNIRVDEDAIFDLQVKVEIRSDDTVTRQPILFESKFHLSTDTVLDAEDPLVSNVAGSFHAINNGIESDDQ